MMPNFSMRFPSLECLIESNIFFLLIGFRKMMKCLICKRPSPGSIIALTIQLMVASVLVRPIPVNAGDTNDVFSPCSDAMAQKSDGFTFGVVFSSKDSFFHDQVQLSPCDRRLNLAGSNARLAVFRPKVDEISLLTINSSAVSPVRTLWTLSASRYHARFPVGLLRLQTYIRWIVSTDDL